MNQPALCFAYGLTVVAFLSSCTESATNYILLNNNAAGDAGRDADASDASDGQVDGDAAKDQQQEPACNASKHPGEDACVIDEAYGVFVSPSGSDTSTCGTESSPCASITKGLARAKASSKNLYVCGDGAAYAEQVAIDVALDGLKVFGGFKCSDWSYDASIRAQVKPIAEGAALRVDGIVKGTWIENFRIESLSATTSGGSSIAVVVSNSVSVQFKGCDIKAGDGKSGEPGTDGVKGEDGEGFAVAQQGTNSVCAPPPPSDSTPGGHWTGLSACGSQGGAGGDGKKGGVGFAGQPGIPDTDVTPLNVDNGGTKALTVGEAGGNGNPGSPGNAGADGTAAGAAGSFSATGYTPATQGGAGQEGHPGQGGGGGGASRAIANCVGASGGAGGMGGCGGKAGTGGMSGGASVGVLSWSSTVKFDSCTITAGKGGAGGVGGAGGAVGLGRTGAPGGFDATGQMAAGGVGGKGGNGGPGSSGAGGSGGPAHAIVYQATAPDTLTSTLIPGTGGSKGKGGTNGVTTAPDGSDGDNATVHQQT